MSRWIEKEGLGLTVREERTDAGSDETSKMWKSFLFAV